MEKYIEKAKVLIEALPYIKEFYGKTVVVKYGGSAMVYENIKNSVMQDIILMKLVGINVVIVHGGGPFINETLERLNIESKFINGLRVTDKATMEVVEMVLSGKVNKSIVEHIQNHGVNAVGISGKDGDTILAKKNDKNGDVGFVGEIVDVNTKLISNLIDNEFIPVIAPIGKDSDGNTYNINADIAAVAIASHLKAQKLVFLSDIEGVLRDVEDKSSLIQKLYLNKIDKYIEDGVIKGGMIPKVVSCADGIRNGINTVHILDGRVEHSLLLEIFTTKGIGTMILK